MINKYQISISNIQINQPCDNDKDTIKQLWLDSFKDEDQNSTNFYFDNYYKKKYTYILKNNNEILSSLQIKPITIIKNKQKIKSMFIIGVCTNEKYQKQGLMKLLLNYVLELHKDYPIYLQAYNPSIYHSFGFYASHYHQIITLDQSELNKEDLIISSDVTLMKKYYSYMMLNFDHYKYRCNHDWELLLMRVNVFNEKYMIFENNGYIIFSENENEMYIHELIYIDEQSLNHILNYLKDIKKKIIIECDLKAKIPGQSYNTITMMCNQYNYDIMDESYYINEIY